MTTSPQSIMRNQILHGDARELAKTLPDESVHCIVTSPPYWNLRNYGVDGQLGLEQSPNEYVAEMVALFRELRRTLREDGTLWLNLGSSYAGSGGAGGDYNEGGLKEGQPRYGGTGRVAGFKPKDLIPIPHMVAIALQQDGWWLRCDVIWHKKSPMPSSAMDRPTIAHEYLFLMSKSAQYFYDAVAVREPNSSAEQLEHNLKYAKPYEAYDKRGGPNGTGQPGNENNRGIHARPGGAGRNMRSVLTLGPEPTPFAHFATFPKALVRPCILAGTSAKGVCPKCLAPWERVVERIETGWDGSRYGERAVAASGGAMTGGTERSTLGSNNGTLTARRETTGWQPTCSCDAGDPIPAVVLDPFIGSGTTAAVAIETGRDWLGFELNADYIELAYRRIHGAQPALFAQGEYA